MLGFPDSAEVSVGDIIRTLPANQNGDLSVVFAVRPSLQVASMVRTEDGSFRDICAPGTYSGPVEVIGNISVDELLEGHVKYWPAKMADEIREINTEHLRAQVEQGPVTVTNFS